MSFNKDSNTNIIMFLVVMVVIVATTLSLFSDSLSGLINKNKEVDTKSQILKSVMKFDSDEEASKFYENGDKVLQTFDENITEYVVNYKGEVTQKDSAFAIELKTEEKKDLEERSYPLLVYKDGSDEYYIFPLAGKGLWDKIWGYLAVKQDFRTIQGAAFDHAGETPGLGAEIATDWFRKQFEDKKLYDKSGEYQFQVLKGKGNELNGFQVDGMSGATFTGRGADEMIAKCVKYYEPYFEKAKK